MQLKLYIYDSFTEEKFKGNQAGIILDAENLKEEDMQKIAKELNYSETAFLFKSKNAFKKIKFFTPNSEVDLCGHATIAAVKCLYDNNLLDLKEGENTINLETNLGLLPVIINIKNDKFSNIVMYQDEAKINDKIELEKAFILNALGLTEADSGNLEIVKAYTGLWDLMISLKNKESLFNIKADMNKIKEISKKLDIISFHPFVLENNNQLTAYVRNFAPIVDIDEEAATGTSNGALAYYLYKSNILKENEKLVCRQGEIMGRESEIITYVKEGKVLVGGTAIKVFEGILEI